MSMYDDDDIMYGQATSDGAYDDVETYDHDGTPTTETAGFDLGLGGGALLIILSLAALWALGGPIFKGSNQS